MQELRLIGVHEDGQHLLLGAEDGAQFRVALTDDLRAAARRGRPDRARLPADAAGGALRPRDVQALIRAGASAEEVADQSGWSVEKVHRYEGPILAEREHVAGLGRGVRVRGRAHAGVAPTLESRIADRLRGRGVDPTSALWDAHRAEGGPWTLVVTFPAGGREREACWHFDVPDRAITSLDDEARWLSGDDDTDSGGPVPAPQVPPAGRSTRVYDVEAEGGLRATPRPGEDERAPAPAAAGRSGGSSARAEQEDEPADLMTAMRERSAASRASRRARRRGSRRSPTEVPGDEQPPEDALPLEHIPYDAVTSGVPPAAHADPDPDGPDGTPEPEARADPEPAAAPDAETTDPEPAEAPDSEDTNPEASDAEATDPEPAEAPEPEATTDPGPAAGAAAEPPQQPARRKAGRPSVPSWDDIMFGSRPGSD